MPGAAAEGAQPARPGDAGLIDNLELLARGDHAQLMKVCNVDSEDLLDMVAEIRSLSPKPG